MKSPMVRNLDFITDKDRYTEMQVLRSGAGFYVGTLYNNPAGFIEPGSRDSDYFETKEAAQAFLETLQGLDDKTAALCTRAMP